MTTCAECLTALSTTRLADFNGNPALIAHCSTCEPCAHALSDFQLAERRLTTTLAELRPLPRSDVVASAAIAGSEKLRRRTAARWFRGAIGVAALALLGSYVREELWPKWRPTVVTETIPLRCMTTEAATAVVTPYLRSNSPAVYSAPGVRAITIRGVDDEAARAIRELRSFESKLCDLPDGGGAPVIPSDETPGKD